MALASRKSAKPVYGHAKPRIAPPIPARHDAAEFIATAKAMGLEPMPWQGQHAARYLTARGPDGLLYREVAIVVARQNGKTTLMKPYIVGALRAGLKVMHVAQNRELPRAMFAMIADALSGEPELFPKRRGRTIWPRFGSGQEEITLVNGGSYRIAASSSGGARGWPNDRIIIDELREMKSYDAMGAIEPTLTMSQSPQVVYLSNAGTEESVVLNDLRNRGVDGSDPNLAYLEWSSSEERATDEVDGWAEANPALGHYPSVMRTLEAAYLKHSSRNTLHIFNTEHLCRWVTSDLPAFIEATIWTGCRVGNAGIARRPVLGIALDPSGKRASMALAWQDSAGIAVRLLGDVTGDPIDTDALGNDLAAQAGKMGVMLAGHDPETDAHLAKFLRKVEPVTGAKFTAACSRFVELAESRRLRWEGPDEMAEDIRWTTRRTDPQDGTFRAVKAKEDRPVTSILAAIRAVWLVDTRAMSGPRVM